MGWNTVFSTPPLHTTYITRGRRYRVTMETLEHLISEAEAGDVQSCFELGQRFATGEGAEADEKTAFDWYLRAARRGHVMAQNAVGVCYLNGIVVGKNAKEANMWFLRAALKGNADAYRTLSRYYETHETPNDEQVYRYFEKAASSLIKKDL